MSDEPDNWILRGAAELEEARQSRPVLGDAVIGEPLRPGSREFLDVLDEWRSLHLRKTLDYGVDDDALANIRNSADIANIEPWVACLVRIADKVQRLRSFLRRGQCEFDGVLDTIDDIGCYSAIAKVMYREAVRKESSAA